ncbi:hypothetical protein KI387_031230, partial [Taxus chinensis]
FSCANAQSHGVTGSIPGCIAKPLSPAPVVAATPPSSSATSPSQQEAAPTPSSGVPSAETP